jgi:hypothetical protein
LQYLTTGLTLDGSESAEAIRQSESFHLSSLESWHLASLCGVSCACCDRQHELFAHNSSLSVNQRYTAQILSAASGGSVPRELRTRLPRRESYGCPHLRIRAEFAAPRGRPGRCGARHDENSASADIPLSLSRCLSEESEISPVRPFPEVIKGIYKGRTSHLCNPSAKSSDGSADLIPGLWNLSQLAR